ncbi:MAG TPA: DUF4870 domain-containing protein [Demequinaceae bacterium]
MAELTSDERTQGMLAHLLNIFFPAVGPLVIWLIGKDKSAFVDTEGKEALNWGITLVAGWIVGGILLVVLIGILILMAVGIAALVFGIMGAIAANKGQNYRYPFTFRFIK